MITKEQATNIANEYILERSKRGKHILQLMLERTIEFELGWVFFYQTKEFIETRDRMKALIGNAPIIINKKTGEIKVTGTAHHINRYIIEYFQQEEKKQKSEGE